MLGSLILYLKGMRIVMFQLSGFYCRGLGFGFFCFRLPQWFPWRHLDGFGNVRFPDLPKPLN